MNLKEKFNSRLQKTGSLLCIGLDPELEKLPEFIQGADDPLYNFSKEIVDATNKTVLAYKINIAFFERFGSEGFRQFESITKYIQKNYSDILIIADAKRGDLANTAKEYAKYYFQKMKFDALTVSPYMGSDSLVPFLEEKESFIFVLCVTSNEGAKELQNQTLRDGETLYEHVADMVELLNTKFPGRLGLVVGATKPKDLENLRISYPNLPFLIPGLGAQGGNLIETMKVSGNNSLLNFSRTILFASSGKDFAEKAKEEAEKILGEMIKN